MNRNSVIQLKSKARMNKSAQVGSTAKMVFTLALTFALSVGIYANDRETRNQRPGKQYLGPTADSIQPYKPAGRDPFKKYIKPKAPKGGKAKQAVALGFPPLDMRRAEFRQRVEVARSRDLPEPDPVLQYLVSELDITGIFRDQRGYGAFVRAQPTGTMFFVRNGAQCYNGEILRIEGDGAESGGAKVVFKERSYMEINGKQSPQERVVAKAPIAPEKK